jgi:hypothetical protein
MVEAMDEYDQMLKDFEKRKDQYGFVEIRCVSVRGMNEKGENIWIGVAIKVIPHRKDEEKEEKRNYNYGDVIFRRIYIPAEDFLKILRNLRETRILRIPGEPELEYKIEGLKREYPEPVYSQRAQEFGVEWPCILYYSVRIPPVGLIHENKPLVRLNLPFYPYFSIAFESEMDMIWNNNFIVNVIIPDYRARIRKLKILSKRLIKVEIDTFSIPLDKIAGKYWCSLEKGYRTGDFDIKSGIIELDGEIKYMQVALVSKEEEEILDSRWFSMAYGGRVEFEPTEENLESIIYQGENERVEFKLNTDNEEDLLETIVAFANKFGGIILIGVDDNGEIKGFEWKKEKKGEPLKDWLSKIIRGRCDPSSIDFDVKEIYVREKPLTLIEVEEGKNKPYLLKDKCPYIRVGSTDRCMTREELDDIYKRKSQETTGFIK